MASYITSYKVTWNDDTLMHREVALALTRAATEGNAAPSRGTPEGLEAANVLMDRRSDRWMEVMEGAETVNWTNRPADMARVSILWPQVRFTVKGDDEEPQRPWREYYQDGRFQRVEGKPVFPEFDSAQLKEPERLLRKPLAAHGQFHRKEGTKRGTG